MKKKKVALLTTFLVILTMTSQVFAAVVKSTNSTSSSNVAIVNNYVGTNDTITIAANTFQNGDKISVADSKKNVLDSETISNSATATSISIAQLTQAKGKISISVTNSTTGATATINSINYVQEKSPVVVTTSAISIVSNADTPDVITVTGLEAGDVVIAYADNTTTKSIAKSAVTKDSTATIKLGTIRFNPLTGMYISVIRKGATESDRVLVTGKYTAPLVTPSIAKTDVIGATNAVMVRNLAEKDIITVYSAAPNTLTDAKAVKAATLATAKFSKGNTYALATCKTDFPKTIYVTWKTAGKAPSGIIGTLGTNTFTFVSQGNSGTKIGTGTDITSKFTDANFKSAVYSAINKKSGDTILDDDVVNIQSLDITNKSISSLSGIEYFESLSNLSCGNNNLTTLDLSKNTALIALDCTFNKLTTLDVSKNVALTQLSCNGNSITSLDLTKNIALTALDCTGNKITTLDVTKNTALTQLTCDDNSITSLDLTNNTALLDLSFAGTSISSIDLSKNTLLVSLQCTGAKLATLDVSNNTALDDLLCSNNALLTLDISKNKALTMLDCRMNQIATLYSSTAWATSCYQSQYADSSHGSTVTSLTITSKN